jgi:hypothetical protein
MINMDRLAKPGARDDERRHLTGLEVAKRLIQDYLERITSQCTGEPQGATQARAAATGIVLKACAIAPASA